MSGGKRKGAVDGMSGSMRNRQKGGLAMGLWAREPRALYPSVSRSNARPRIQGAVLYYWGEGLAFGRLYFFKEALSII